MKTVIFGIGRMGTAIAFAMRKLGYSIVGVDSVEEGKNRLIKVLGDENFIFYKTTNLEHDLDGILEFEKPDIVISSLPYHQTFFLANYCIVNGLRYCDLGGSVPVSEKINNRARGKAQKPVMTDLGLAPGWVNILAEEGCRKIHGQVEDVKMMVGGLPDYLNSTNNPLRYAVTWSVDGLINEYKDDCLVLENGEIKTVKGMDGLEQVEGKKFGEMEAFYTSGGASHSIYSMKKRGVKNCSYKTLRYPGHRDIVEFLIRDCGLDDHVLEQIFVNGCGYVKRDEVFVVAKVSGEDKTWEQEKVIKSDDKFSAMQRATAFPIAAVASLMGEGKLEGDKDQHRDYHTQYPKALTYKDIPTEEFNERVTNLGLNA